jgi:hypothetical protein
MAPFPSNQKRPGILALPSSTAQAGSTMVPTARGALATMGRLYGCRGRASRDQFGSVRSEGFEPQL